jgi:hypothetical protein
MKFRSLFAIFFLIFTHLNGNDLFAKSPVTVLAPSIQVLKSSRLVVAREAGNCAKWYWLPSEWNVNDNRVDTYLEVEKKGRDHFMVASIRYSPVSARMNSNQMTSEILQYINSQNELEQQAVLEGKLKAEDTFYFRRCDLVANSSQPIEISPFPLGNMKEIQVDDTAYPKENDPKKRFLLKARFVATDNKIPDLVIDAREALERNDAKLYRLLTQPHNGILPFPVEILVDAIDIGTEAWLKAGADAIAQFQVNLMRATNCTTSCSHFLFWSRCKTDCWTREWIEQYLKSFDIKSQANTYVLVRPNSLTEREAITQLLSEFMVSGFGENITQIGKNVTQINLGQHYRSEGTEFSASIRDIFMRPISFFSYARIKTGLSAKTRKPIEDLLAKETK